MTYHIMIIIYDIRYARILYFMVHLSAFMNNLCYFLLTADCSQEQLSYTSVIDNDIFEKLSSINHAPSQQNGTRPINEMKTSVIVENNYVVKIPQTMMDKNT